MDDHDYLEMMTPDQIDFSELSTKTSWRLVYGDGPFIATSALGELTSRDKELALKAAVDILFNNLSDKFLQAATFDIIYCCNRNKVWEYLEKYAATCDLYILNSIIQELCIDGDNIKEHQMKSISAIKNRLQNNADEEGLEPELRREFLELFGD